MTKPSANLMVALFDHAVCVKIIGRADFTSSLDLKKVVGELCDRSFNHFIFDLSECLTMDSTFLGVLSGIGLRFSNGNRAQVGSPLELLNPNPRITETLENLGVADLFTVRNCGDQTPNGFQPVDGSAEKSPLALKRNCLEAHETLMALQPENVQRFKDVTQFLAEDLKKLENGASN